MPGFSINVPMRQIKEAWKELDKKGILAADLKPPLKRFNVYYGRMIDRTFKERGRPAGSWKPLSPYTLAMRSWKATKGRKKGGFVSIMPLIATGHLRRTFTGDVQKLGMKYGTTVDYAVKHQKGGWVTWGAKTIKAKNAKALQFSVGGKDIYRKSVWHYPKNVKVPVRKIITWLPEDATELERLVEEHVGRK